MMHLQHDIACCISFLFILNLAKADFQNYLNPQRRTNHLSDNKFSFSEYMESSDNDERDRTSSISQWNQMYQNVPKTTIDNEQNSDLLNKNITWESQWAKNIKFGDVSAVSIDPNGNIGIFHRGTRVWGLTTFNNENIFNKKKGPIQENTVILLDKFGEKLLEWGAKKFYLPHGLTIDTHGNYWITDVALHQVFKFDSKDIARLRKGEYNQETMFSDLKPSLVLGEAFIPGNDDKRFCKPTAVAVESNGDFFVSDGYCNSRIIKFNAKGERILKWGRTTYTYAETGPVPNAFNIPHALALASELNLLFVADRQNGRVVSFFATNGTFYKEYKDFKRIGPLIYSVAYAKGRLYLINYPSSYNIHVQGFVLDVNSGNILFSFRPGQDMNSPHDIAVSADGSEIYVAELNKNTVYKFLQNINTSVQTGNSMVRTNPHHEPAPLTDSDMNNPTGGTTTATLVLSLVTAAVIFIALCVAIAAVLARCQKRGRLFQYDESAVEFSKLVE